LLCPSRSLWRRAWQDRFSQNNTKPTRPRPRPIFLVSDRSCPKTDGLRHTSLVIERSNRSRIVVVTAAALPDYPTRRHAPNYQSVPATARPQSTLTPPPSVDGWTVGAWSVWPDDAAFLRRWKTDCITTRRRQTRRLSRHEHQHQQQQQQQ